MPPFTHFSRRLRWAVPAGAVAVTGGVVAASLVPAALATPPLPQRTPAQLLAAVAGRTGPPPALTGTVVETAALGLPDLPGVGDPTSLQSLLTGSHTIRVWYADPQHVRLAIPGQLSETDVIRSGQDVWTWSSVRNTATHLRLPERAAGAPEPSPQRSPLTPQQAANQALAAVGPTTRVSVASNVMVAGEPCYELVLAPKASSSLVGQVRIAIDGQRDVPLRVQVFARGSAAPAFQTGFTSIAFIRPAAANFTFTPPSGAKVVQQRLPAGQVAAAKADARARASAGASIVGQGWLAVAVLPTGGSAPGGSNARADRQLGALLRSATPVQGSWGSGRLLRTKLLSVLLTSDGRLLIGAVTPDVLYTAAGAAGQAGK